MAVLTPFMFSSLTEDDLRKVELLGGSLPPPFWSRNDTKRSIELLLLLRELSTLPVLCRRPRSSLTSSAEGKQLGRLCLEDLIEPLDKLFWYGVCGSMVCETLKSRPSWLKYLTTVDRFKLTVPIIIDTGRTNSSGFHPAGVSSN